MTPPQTPEELQRWRADVEMVDERLRQHEAVAREILAELEAAKPWHPEDRDAFTQRQRAASAVLVLCQQVRRHLGLQGGNICHAVIDALAIGQWGGDGAFHFANARQRRRQVLDNRQRARKRGVTVRQKAVDLRAELQHLAKRHDPDEHGPLIPWLANRKGITQRTVRNHLAQGKQRR